MESSPKKDDKIVESSSSPTIDVVVGEQFRIRLKTKISTGYRWDVLENDIIGKVGRSQYITVLDDNIGSDSTQEFYFRADTEGETKLIFRKSRVFEDDVVETHRIPIRVAAQNTGATPVGSAPPSEK